MMDVREWKLTLLSLGMVAMFLFGGCGFLVTGAWWLIGLHIVAGVVYVAAVAHYLETGRDDESGF